MAYTTIEDIFDIELPKFSKEDIERLIENRLASLSISADQCKNWNQQMKIFVDQYIQNDFFYETKR